MIRVEVVDYSLQKEILHSIRHEVFVQEQQVPAELEVDRWDPYCIHVLAQQNGQAVGTGRLLPDGHIGRVAVRRPMRYKGIGKLIMERLLKAACDAGHPQVELSAQCHAMSFYHKLGFREKGEIYLEAGIRHIKMVKPLIFPAPVASPHVVSSQVVSLRASTPREVLYPVA